MTHVLQVICVIALCFFVLAFIANIVVNIINKRK